MRILALLAAAAFAGCAGNGQRVSTTATIAPIKVGKAAPAFSVATTGSPFDSTKAGAKPTLLEAFATWCPHCQREIPVLNGLFARYRGRANIVGVSASSQAQ